MYQSALPRPHESPPEIGLDALETQIAMLVPALLPLTSRFSVERSDEGVTFAFGLRRARLRQRGPAVVVEALDRQSGGPLLAIATLPEAKALAALVAVALTL